MTGLQKHDAGFDDSSVEPGVWRYERAQRASLVVDGELYFGLIQEAMLKARYRVLLIGWDFDTRIHLARGRRWWQRSYRRTYPSRLGSFIPWIVRHNNGVEFRILKWSFGLFKFAVRGAMWMDLLRWWPNRNIDFKLDSAHPVACSHHQKIVVIDRQFAVCGGIDMTTRRWDTREHKEHDERRERPDNKLYGPWHDVTMMLEGPIAGALEELGRDRWIRAGGKPLSVPPWTKGTAWPDDLKADFENVEIGISRSRAPYRKGTKVDEVEELFLRHIREAKHFIYAESQYFASRSIAEAIAERLEEDDPPEFVIVNPATADGWVESNAMDPVRARLFGALKALDDKNRFHLYVPFTGETPIYVHAKLMIVDDAILRVGSSNFNNRSMGLDSECDVFVDSARPGNGHCGETIRRLRHSMIAEHCGLEEDDVPRLLEEHGSMAALIDSRIDNRPRHLRPFEPEELTETQIDFVDSEMFDPEEPAEMFQILKPDRGLLRRGGLLAKAVNRMKRKRRRS